jgi:hypothetical protein
VPHRTDFKGTYDGLDPSGRDDVGYGIDGDRVPGEGFLVVNNRALMTIGLRCQPEPSAVATAWVIEPLPLEANHAKRNKGTIRALKAAPSIPPGS